MKIYVASSWRNQFQPDTVKALRAVGHDVYDFKNPSPGEHGFSWSAIDPEWKGWSPEEFRLALAHPIANHGYGLDWGAMLRADGAVLCLPAGRSAHIEAGYFVGAGKRLWILTNGVQSEPELMYKMADAICHSVAELIKVIPQAFVWNTPAPCNS